MAIFLSRCKTLFQKSVNSHCYAKAALSSLVKVEERQSTYIFYLVHLRKIIKERYNPFRLCSYLHAETPC